MQKKLRSYLDLLLEALGIALFAFMVAVGTYQILGRYLFNRPSTVSEELLTYAFAWMSLLAATYVFGKRGHMRMGFLIDKLSGKVKTIIDMVIECLILVFSAVVLVYGGIQITSLTMTQKTASLGIPMGYVYVIVPVCGILVIVYSILNLLDLWSGDGNVQEMEIKLQGKQEMKKKQKESQRHFREGGQIL